MAMTDGITPVMNVGNDGYGWNGGMWFVWLIVIFALMGGNGFGNYNRGDYATQAQVYASNDQQSLMGAINTVREGNIALGNGLSDLGYALNSSILNGFANTGRDIANGTYVVDKAITDTRYVLGNAINEGRFSAQQNANMLGRAIDENRFATQCGFCNLNQSVQNVNYANAMNTCAIKENETANTQKILDKLASMENNAKDAQIADLRQQLNVATLAYSQQNQNATIINALRPYPAPTYPIGCFGYNPNA